MNSSLNSFSAAIDSLPSSEILDEFINYPDESSTQPATTKIPPPSSKPFTSPLHCKQCQRAFPSVSSIMQHIAGWHRLADSEQWPCTHSDCLRTFRSDKDLRRHLMDIHLGIKYTCSCARRDRRDKHLSHIHDAVRKCRSLGPYICGCGKATDRNGPNALSDHVKHITEAIFTCSCRQKHRLAEHLSHLQHHQCKRGASYICHCGNKTDSHTDTGLEDHRRHVQEACLHGPSYSLDGQRRQRGRPRKMIYESKQQRNE